MLEELLVQCCAPTLAGLKTGSLFSASCRTRRTLAAELRRLNALFACRGLRLVCLRYAHGRALLYLFRPARLLRDLREEEAAALLRRAGYPETQAEACLWRLSLRLRAKADFPHEIGLFLGYPPEDVRGFIEQRGRGFKQLGLWKVYGDTRKAARSFARCRQCTEIYRRALRAGRSLTQLAVRI